MFAKPTLPPDRVNFDDGTTQLSLSRARTSDAPALVEAIVDSLPELRAFMPWAHMPENNTVTAQEQRLTQLETSWDDKKDFVWHLFQSQGQGTPRFVGCVGMHPRCLNPLGLEIGYWIRSDSAGRGLCTLAAKIAALIGVQHMGLERVQVGCDENNLGSRRVIEKVGFSFEGRLRKMLPALPDEARSNGWAGSGHMEIWALTDDEFGAIRWVTSISEHLSVP